MSAPSDRALLALGLVEAEQRAKAAARKARELFAALVTKYTLTIKMPAADVQHLLWFDAGTPRRAGNRGRGRWHQRPRPVLKINKRARTEALAAFKAHLVEGLRAGRPLNYLVALTAAGNAIRAVYVQRLSTSGGDVRIAPLTSRYLARKRRRGLDLRIGVATGSLLRAVSSGLVTVRRA